MPVKQVDVGSNPTPSAKFNKYEKRIRHALRSAKQQTQKRMSVNTNRAKLNKANNGREYGNILSDILYPLYWDEGCNMYPRYRRGYKNSGKQIFSYQRRMYRTWKHNRKTRWK